MILKGIVNRIWRAPGDTMVSLMLQGNNTVHRILVHEVADEQVGLTKAGDVLEVKTHETPSGPSASQWNNETLAADMGQ